QVRNTTMTQSNNEDPAVLNALVEEGGDLRDRYLRALAELENLRKRKRVEIEQAREQAEAEILKMLLPIIDNMERAVQAAAAADTPEAAEGVRRGVEYLLDFTRHVLKKIGV